eukprot:1129583-Amorphochlora_amoeboformis.AAC.1
MERDFLTTFDCVRDLMRCFGIQVDCPQVKSPKYKKVNPDDESYAKMLKEIDEQNRRESEEEAKKTAERERMEREEAEKKQQEAEKKAKAMQLHMSIQLKHV